MDTTRKPFRHFIITRFNVCIERVEFVARLDDAWLSLRFDLFQKFCFPSVRSQSCQDFTWLVLFDEQTPKAYRRIISLYAKYENFVPIFCGPFHTVMPEITRAIKERSDDAHWLLTTRLDNDDALAASFVNILQPFVTEMFRQPRGLDTCFLNFTHGLQYSNGDLYAFSDETNAFASLLERSENPKTIYWVDHPAIAGKAPVVQIETAPLWLQNIHETNLYNHIRGERVDDGALLKDFALNRA